VTISAPTASKAAAAEMDPKKKKLIMVGVLVAASAVVLYLQYRPSNTLDSEAAANPNVAQVVELERKGDTNALARIVKSDDPMAARRAVSALASKGAFEQFRDALRDNRDEVRYAAVSGLANAGDPAYLDDLSRFTQDPKPEIRMAAVRGMSSIRDFAIFDRLMPMLSDPSPNVRRAAITVIQERSGLLFRDYNPDGPAETRGRAIGPIRASVAKMKEVFDRANEFELKHQGNGKR